jgi:hypothetical protein
MEVEREKRITNWFLRFNILSACFWFGPGTALALIYPKSVLYVSLMSSFANGMGAVGAIMSTRTVRHQLEAAEREEDN